MRAVEIIEDKRDKKSLSREQIDYFVRGITDGSIPDYQISAWAMAVLLNGMNERETTDLTLAMAESGEILDLSKIAPIVVDKHSTGGVGDKTSLVVAPLVSSLGLPVGKMSGRGLGFSGGTLDKLESIPGYRVDLTKEEFMRQLEEIGIVLTGQTADLAPADGKLYALRDVTGTVPSLPLIASSIMSKKLAEGIDALVLDVKVGSGAFMRTETDARKLAETLVGIGKGAGKKVTAYLTDMNQVLGRQVGNANETAEAIEVLRGGGPTDIRELTVALGAEMLLLANVASDIAEGRKRMEQALDDGTALERFRRMVEAQKGDPRVTDDLSLLPQAAQTLPVIAPTSGFITAMNSRDIGIGAMILGAGRRRAEDEIDPAVGVTIHKKIGDAVEGGEPLADILHNGKGDLEEAMRLIQTAFEIEAQPPTQQPLILDRITSE